ncbi:MAG: tRNA lysidine(34) synthetase TilS [Bacteroidota bacterium]
MLKKFNNFILKTALVEKSQHILLSVSGGIDSMVMTALFHQAKLSFGIAHCNFGLRGIESDEDERFVIAMAGKYKVPCFIKNFNTSDYAHKKGISIQMAARELRYNWFEIIREQEKFDLIATAHHLDDQVETFLINLIRGTGIAGLHGIPIKNGNIIRPMMFAFRKEVEKYASERQILYREDRSNSEIKYLRNKIRHEVIPLLCSINPEFKYGLTESIARISGFEQIGNHAMEDWCRKAMTTDGKDKFIDINNLLKATPVESFAWALLSPFGFNETQVSNLLGCLEKENRKIFCSSTHRLVKDRERLVINAIEPKTKERSVIINHFSHRKSIKIPIPLVFTRVIKTGKYEIPASGMIATLDFGKLTFPLSVRRWRPGDAFFPFGMKNKKKLSDFFIDQKFSLKQKEQTWLLYSGNNIAWIIGHRIDNRYRVTSATQEMMCIVTETPDPIIAAF